MTAGIHQVAAVSTRELRQIVRDRRTLVILIFVPALFLLLYGYALNFDIRNIPMAVDDRDRTAESRDFVSAFVQSGYFTLVEAKVSEARIDELIDRNQVRAVLVIPAGFASNLTNARPSSVQVIVDGDNANTATTVTGYVQAIVAEFSAEAMAAIVQRRPSGLPVPRTAAAASPIVFDPRVWYNPQLRSTLFLVPGLIAYIVMITAVISTALSIVREKERGTMEQIRMSPLSPAAFVLGKTVPYLVLSFASAMLIIVAAMALFDLPMNGSWTLLSVSIVLFIVGAQAQGLLISSIAPTQQVAFQAALLSSFLPTFILSGFIFPITSMPAPVQMVTYVIPARYFLVALRAIVLKGAPLPAFWQDLAALVAFATIALALSAVRLSREWK